VEVTEEAEATVEEAVTEAATMAISAVLGKEAALVLESTPALYLATAGFCFVPSE